MLNAAQGCRTLLLELYNLSQKSRLDEHVLLPEQVSEILRVDIQDTIPIIDFLEQSGYIKCGRPIGRTYSWVKLTSKGMLLVMNSSEFEQVFHELAPAAQASDDKHDIAIADRETKNISFNLQMVSQGTNIPTEILIEIKKSLYEVAEALQRQDDRPLKDFLSLLILRGGLESTLVGVKALLAVHGIEI